MTFKVVKFNSTKTSDPHRFLVGFNGDDRFFHKIEIHTDTDFGPDVLDYIELYAMWFYIMGAEFCGSGRTSRNLKVVVSRGAIKKLLRESSSKSHLFRYTNAIRTQLFGLTDIEVDKNPAWDADLQPNACVRWDGSVPEYPEVENPLVGMVGVTFHALERYYDATNREGRADLIYYKVCRLLREAEIRAQLPDKVLKHKELKYGAGHSTDTYLQTSAGWQAVIVSPPGEQKLLVTVYMSSAQK
jgi:hypothetical protein